MTEARYKIVFDGQLMPEMTLEIVKSNLARLFKSDLSKIDSLFGGPPLALKRDLSEAEADKYLHALQQAGAQVRKERDLAASLSLVETDDHREAAPGADGNNESMHCPKCGHAQAKSAECTACGIIIDKYLARQALQPNPAPTVSETTEANSPYSTPKAEVAGAQGEYGELKVLTVDGRIGRVRYLGWCMALGLLAILVYAIVAGAMFISTVLGSILMMPLVIATMVVSVMIGVQRLHDIGWSGWLWLLNLIPLVGSVFALLMLIIPGSQGSNRYGPPPPPNSTGVIALAWSGLLIPLLGILAAIAIPSYQGYIERAEQVQQIQHTPESTE